MGESVNKNNNSVSQGAISQVQSTKFSYINNNKNISNNKSSVLADSKDNTDSPYENRPDEELLKTIKKHRKKEAEYDEETVRHQTSHQQDDTCKDFADKYTIAAKLTASGVDPRVVSDLAKFMESASFDDSIDLSKDMKKVINGFVKADTYSDNAINQAMYNGTERISEYESKANQAYKKAWHSVNNM